MLQLTSSNGLTSDHVCSYNNLVFSDLNHPETSYKKSFVPAQLSLREGKREHTQEQQCHFSFLVMTTFWNSFADYVKPKFFFPESAAQAISPPVVKVPVLVEGSKRDHAINGAGGRRHGSSCLDCIFRRMLRGETILKLLQTRIIFFP